MKIDDAYKTADLGTTQASQAGRAGQAPKMADAPRSTTAPGADAVQLSDEARLRAEALRAAADAPAIRPDAVARGKALLESGALGRDPDALADRLIDALLDESAKG
ncbi:MAG: flagellar biosynthesis anti-sigma factor FlgM [Vicinamibacterales bacterium]